MDSGTWCLGTHTVWNEELMTLQQGTSGELRCSRQGSQHMDKNICCHLLSANHRKQVYKQKCSKLPLLPFKTLKPTLAGVQPHSLGDTAALQGLNQGNQERSPPGRLASSFFHFLVTSANPNRTKHTTGTFIEF